MLVLVAVPDAPLAVEAPTLTPDVIELPGPEVVVTARPLVVAAAAILAAAVVVEYIGLKPGMLTQ